MKLNQLLIVLLYLFYSIDSCKGQVTESTGDVVLQKISSILGNWPKLKLMSFSFFNNYDVQQAENIVAVSTVATQEKIANQEAETTTGDVTTDSTDTATEPLSTEVGVTEDPLTEETTETEQATTEAAETSVESTETAIFETTEPEVIETLTTTTRRSVRTTKTRVPASATRTPSYHCICWYVTCGRGRGRHNHRRIRWNNIRKQIYERRNDRDGNSRSQRRNKNGRNVSTQRRRNADYDNAYNKWIRSNSAFYQNYDNNDYTDDMDLQFNNVNRRRIDNTFISNYFNPYEKFARRHGIQRESTFMTTYFSPYEHFSRRNGRIDYQINNGNNNGRNGFPQESTFISNYFSPYEQFSGRNRIRKENTFMSSYFSPYENFSRNKKFEGLVSTNPYWQTTYYV